MQEEYSMIREHRLLERAISGIEGLMVCDELTKGEKRRLQQAIDIVLAVEQTWEKRLGA